MASPATRVSRPVRRAAGWLRLGRGISAADGGQAVVEYVGALVAASVVVVLVVAALAVPASRERIASAVRVAVCEITGGADCGTVDRADSPDAGSSPGADGASPGSVAAGQDSPGRGSDAGTDAWNCSGFWGCTWNGVKQTGSGLFNVGKGAVDDVVGIGDLVTHPGQVLDAGKYIWRHPGDAARQLVWDDESGSMWDRQDYGGAVGRTVWNVGSWFIPGVDIGRGASKLGKLGKLGKVAEVAGDLAKIGELADEAGALARTAERAAARGDVKGAREAAAAARKKADEAQSEARSKGCPVAIGRIPAQRPGFDSVLASGGGGGGHFGSSVVMMSAPLRAAGGCADTSDAADRADRQADAAQIAVDEAALPAAIRDLALAHLTDSGDAVLGSFPGYITKANSKGASFYDIGDAWDALTSEQRWAANTYFLDATADRGDRMLLSVPKTQIRPGTYLAKEVEYLTTQKGYVWVNQWSLRPRG